MSWGTNFGPEEQPAAGGPQIRMIRVGGGDGAAPPSLPGASTKKYRLEFYAQPPPNLLAAWNWACVNF
ncbi:MAG TPA: hypothetical protein VF435_01030 [Pyrinomonadaceae bacterium]